MDDKEDPDGLHLHYINCNQCMICQETAGSALVIDRKSFMAFLEVNVIATKLVLDTFEPGNAVFINIANLPVDPRHLQRSLRAASVWRKNGPGIAPTRPDRRLTTQGAGAWRDALHTGRTGCVIAASFHWPSQI